MVEKDKKIQVDKSFLDKVLKSNSDLRKISEDLTKSFDKISKEFIEFKEAKVELPQISPEVSGQDNKSDIAFMCNTVKSSKPPETIEGMAIDNIQRKEFSQEVKELMLKYQIVQVVASIFKKI